MRAGDGIEDLDERVSSRARERGLKVAKTEAESNQHDESERSVEDRSPQHSSGQNV